MLISCFWLVVYKMLPLGGTRVKDMLAALYYFGNLWFYNYFLKNIPYAYFIILIDVLSVIV